MNQKHFNQIDRFLSGEMPFDEQQAFRKKLLTNSALRQEYNALCDLISGLDSPCYLILRRQIEIIYARETAAKVKKQFSSFNWGKIAAVLLLIISVFYYGYSRPLIK